VSGVDSHGDDEVVKKGMGYLMEGMGMEIIKRKKGDCKSERIYSK
jgi:hypothetical protein